MQKFFNPIFSILQVIDRDVIIYAYFTHIASRTVTDDVMNYITHRIFNTNL